MPTVDSKGRIVLPADVRERLGLGPGSEVTLRAEDDHVVVEPEDDPERIIEDLEALMAEAAAERERREGADGTDDGIGLRDDPIAADQRGIIRRGAGRSSDTDADTDEGGAE